MTLYNFLILVSPSVLIIAALTFTAFMRWVTYKERVALVERGVPIEAVYYNQRLGRRGNLGVLWAGTITATAGLGILLGLWMVGQGIWLIAGFLPFCIGLGILAIYYVTLGANAGHDPAANPQPQEASTPTENAAGR